MSEIAEIPLTQGKVALVDTDDIERVLRHTWCANCMNGRWYAVAYVHGRVEFLHRFIMNLSFGDGLEVDHKNGDGLDCRKENLRLATRSQNLANKDKAKGTYTSKYKGVSYYKSREKWEAYGSKPNGQKMRLGYFTDEVEAALAYDEYAKEKFGEFARTNF